MPISMRPMVLQWQAEVLEERMTEWIGEGNSTNAPEFQVWKDMLAEVRFEQATLQHQNSPIGKAVQ